MLLKILHTKNLPIYRQLLIEEYFLKEMDENLCIINEGSDKSIVLGSFNTEVDFLNKNLINKNPISIVQRFSGGGTVVVDKNTIFISFIFSKKTLNFSYPNDIYKWVGNIYKNSFSNKIFLKENDFVIGDYKCGGNAQYIKKNRWLHHSSFLWDFYEENMDYLLIPKKIPSYRKKRSHSDFLCKIKNHFPKKDLFIEMIKKELEKTFLIETISITEMENLKKPSLIRTKKLR